MTKNFYIFIALLCAMAWGWLLGQQFMQSHNVGLTVCTLKAVTGYPCPSCGTTRSASALIAGRWQEGLYTNPLGVVVLVWLIITTLWLLYDALVWRNTLQQAYKKAGGILQKRYVWIPLAVLIALNWVWNIQKGL
ncbi:DUF2752 domain-containing protein [Capnocytophaga leadbetteri]|uniref:DUF2752 domain-containing protein n=1 Tax=Capnocytophaga leadbetteri TaxID=327575 RepID=UPI0026F0364A|nr:DUF2752 domain-containing protein [Capnocytophaga leadbetteri]